MSIDSGFSKAFQDGATHLQNEANAIRKRQFATRCLMICLSVVALGATAWWLHSITVNSAIAQTKVEVNQPLLQETNATTEQHSEFAGKIDDLYTRSFEEKDNTKLKVLLLDLNKAAWVLTQSDESADQLFKCLKAATRTIELAEQLGIPLEDSWQYYDTYALASYRYWVNKQAVSGQADPKLLDQAIEKQTIAVEHAPINVVPNLKIRLRQYNDAKNSKDSEAQA